MNAVWRYVSASVVLFLLAALLPSSLTAGTDANGFFDTYLTAIGYEAAGSTPAAAEVDQDYLCDGDENESEIVPELGMILGDPLTAFQEDCGELPLANRGFDLDALLVGGELPIREDVVTNSTLDFQAIARTVTGDAALVPTNVMAYTWVYATNHTPDPLPLTMGIGSDDSIQVKVNRVEVFRALLGRGSGGDNVVQDRFPVVLQPGANLIQFKVWQGGGGWNMRARFEAPSDCPAGSRLPRPGIPSDGVTLTIDTVPPAGPLPVIVPATRSIVASGVSPDTVTADITVQLDNGGAPWDLVEQFDAGWELVSSSPAASFSPGQASWSGVTAGSITYTLRRSDVWNAEDGGVSGLNMLANVQAVVGGDNTIPGGLAPYVPRVLMTAPLNMADFDDQGLPFDVDGCNVSPAQIAGDWIVGTDDGGNPVTDANIVPAEGLEIDLDFGGNEGGASQADFLSFSPEAEGRFWTEAGNNLAGMVLQPATSGDGYYDFERGDIFGAVDQTMAVAYFYALNTDAQPRTVVCAFGSDDSGGVRVNGRSAHAITACRGVPPFETADRFEVALDPGKNLVACYAFERGGGFGIRVRFEDERFRPIRIPTTLDPDGYDPAAHPDPGPLETFPQLSVGAILATAAFDISGTGFTGSNMPGANISGDWITGEDGLGNAVDDATIIPQEGMTLFPDFGGASQATGLLEIAQAAKDIFWTDPLNAASSGTNVVRLTSGDGYYDWQRGDIFTATPDPNVTMNVAWFYAVNEDASARCVTLAFGSDDSGGVRVNGRVVHTITIGRGVPAFGLTDRVPVQLDPGKNLISCYTFDNTGGWGLRARFEDGEGNPIIIPTTTDPAGYDPDPAAHPEPQCVPGADAYVRDGGAANGIVTQFLVPLRPFEHGNSGGNTVADAAPENYISAGGDVIEEDGVFEGALVEPGIAGIDDPGKAAITTAVRNGPCGVTKLVKFDGLVDGDGGADPGDFNPEVYYPVVVQTTTDITQISVTMYFFIENLTAAPLPAWFAFASDDGGTLYCNGDWVAEYLPGRGRGGDNVLQTFATSPADLLSGVNLVQFSFKQGTGGVGARIGFFADDCFSTAFGADEVRVSANPPGFTPESLPSAMRELSSYDCDDTGSVTLTVHIPGGGSDNVDLVEVLPDGIVGSNPSAGSFNAAGSTLSFSGQASDGMQITYDVSDIVSTGSFCASNIDGNLIDGDAVFTKDTCRTRCTPISDTGGVPEMLIIGPIDAGGDTSTNSLCDDNGKLPTTDYLANPDFDETDIALGLGDEVAPDFGGLAGGVGVKASPNPQINPRASEGILTTFLARADVNGRINFNQSTLIGDPVDDYIVYGLIYLDNLDVDDRPVVLEVGSDDAVKVLVNGEVLWVNSICRGIPAYGLGDRVQATLQPGKNTVLIAVVERGGGTDVSLVVRDELDVPITDGSIVACRLGEEGPPPTGGFRRGDTDASGVLDISDPIFNLTFQFVGGIAALPCQDAADVDDSGVIDISDPIYNLTFQFVGGIAPPPAPGPTDCGSDPTPDNNPNGELGCEAYPKEKC